MINKTICPRPWTELAIAPSGLFTPCCIFEKPLQKDNGEYFQADKDELSEVWNSKQMREIRLKMLKGEPVDGCQQCYFQEKHSSISKRIESFKYIKNKKMNFDHASTKADGSTESPIITLDLKLGNKCNLACRMCQPKDSSFVSSEFSKMSKDSFEILSYQNTFHYDPFLGKSYDELSSWTTNSLFQSEFKQISDSLISINIAGGEPLILDEFYEYLDYLIEAKQAEKCHLYISTNLTVLPQKVKNRIEKFLSVHWGLSVDTYGERYNYIRYPANWSKFKENINKLKDWWGENKKVSISICPTIQIYNIYHIDELLLFYLEEVFPFFTNSNFFINTLTYPEHLSIKFLPQKVRKKASAKIQTLLNSEEIKRKINPITQSGLEQVTGILNKNMKGSEVIINQFLSYTYLLDKRRKQSFDNSFPELSLSLKSFLNDYSPKVDGMDLESLKTHAFSMWKRGELKEALSLFQYALTKKHDPHVISSMAGIYQQMGDKQSAINHYEQVMQLKPLELHEVKTLGWLYKGRKEYTKSLKMFSHALKLNKESVDAINEINDLKKLIEDKT